MSGKFKQLISIVSVFSLSIFCSGESQPLFETFIRNSIPHITNHAPQFESSQFVELNKLYSIPTYGETDNGDPYEISFIGSMDVDEDDNLYVLAVLERTITVFDTKGQHLRTFGGQGQGPKEISGGRHFIYDKGLLYIVEGSSGIKVWDKYGEYIKKVRVQGFNNETFLKSDKWYVTGENFIPDINNPNWILIFKKYSKDTLSSTEILTQEYNLYNDIVFGTFPAFSIDAESNFYFLENQSTYTMIKYNDSGDKVLSFSRDHNQIRYSEKAVDKYNSTHSTALAEGRISAIPDYPQPIRKSLIDSRGNIWILSGESSLDNDVSDFQSTVDIFNSEGQWLQSFNSNVVTPGSIIRNDRFYSPSIFNREVEQFINVFEIIYK